MHMQGCRKYVACAYTGSETKNPLVNLCLRNVGISYNGSYQTSSLVMIQATVDLSFGIQVALQWTLFSMIQFMRSLKSLV